MLHFFYYYDCQREPPLIKDKSLFWLHHTSATRMHHVPKVVILTAASYQWSNWTLAGADLLLDHRTLTPTSRWYVCMGEILCFQIRKIHIELLFHYGKVLNVREGLMMSGHLLQYRNVFQDHSQCCFTDFSWLQETGRSDLVPLPSFTTEIFDMQLAHSDLACMNFASALCSLTEGIISEEEVWAIIEWTSDGIPWHHICPLSITLQVHYNFFH